jgi:hypothetical protein
MKNIILITFIFFINIVFSELLDLTKLIDLSKITDINITKNICDDVLNEQKELGILSKSYTSKTGKIDNKKIDKNTINIIVKKMINNGNILLKCNKFKIKTQKEIDNEKSVEKYFEDKANEYRNKVKKIKNGECIPCKNNSGEDKCLQHIELEKTFNCPEKEFSECITDYDCRNKKVCKDYIIKCKRDINEGKDKCLYEYHHFANSDADTCF